MKGAIATSEIFVQERPGEMRRLTLTIAAPERLEAEAGWSCRVALADVHPAEACWGADSGGALLGALGRARVWLTELEAAHGVLFRDRAATTPFEMP